MRWAGHVTRLGKRRGVYRVFGGETLEDRGMDGKIILRQIFRKWEWGAWTGLIWFKTGRGGGFLSTR